MATATEPTVVNPLTQGTPKTLLPQPCAFVIFGAAGDLSWRKLLPALYNLNLDGVLPSNFAVVGFGIGSQGDPDEWFRNRARDGIKRFSRQPLDESAFADFARMLFYVEGSFNDARAYEHLKSKVAAVDQQFAIPNSRVYYLAVPPSAVEPSVTNLKAAGMVHPDTDLRAFSRVIVEKPIGRDLQSAEEEDVALAKAFAEDQTYRIDNS